MIQNPNRPVSPDVRMHRTRRKFRERMGVNIYVLPNLLTTGNMFCGFFSLIYAIRGEFIIAAYAWDPLESTCRHASLSIL